MISKTTKVPAIFEIEFLEEINGLERQTIVALWLGVVIMSLVTILKMYYYIRLNSLGRFQKVSYLSNSFLVKLVFELIHILLESYGTVMFYVQFFICALWFIFYKMQDNCRVLLPIVRGDNNAYQTFNYFIMTTLIAKLLAVLIHIFK